MKNEARDQAGDINQEVGPVWDKRGWRGQSWGGHDLSYQGSCCPVTTTQESGSDVFQDLIFPSKTGNQDFHEKSPVFEMLTTNLNSLKKKRFRIGDLRTSKMSHTKWVKVAQSCLTLCDPMDYTYSPWNSLGQNTGVGSHSLLQGIFPTQESNWGLLHCRQILYQLSYQGSPNCTKNHFKFLPG